MKLNDVYTKPLKDVVEELNLMNGATWTAHVQPWTNTRSRRRRRENNGRS